MKRKGRASDVVRFLERLYAARECLEGGDRRGALAHAGEAAREDRRRPEPYALIGEIQLGAGEPDEALAAFERAARKARRLAEEDEEERPLLVEALWGVARARLLTGRLEQAAGSLAQLVEEAPEAGAAQLLAEVHFALGHPQRALDVVADLDEPRADALLLRALALHDLGRRDDAASALRAAFTANPYLAGLLLGRDLELFDVVPDAEESGPEFAEDLVERLAPVLDARPELRSWIGDVAGGGFEV